MGSVLIGLGFAARWMPCIGPILSSIISLSASRPDEDMTYVAAYTIGLVVPAEHPDIAFVQRRTISG
ncbi:cytochrome c biogenesis protein CcdA [Bacillus paramycoides]|uniref:cytochrome c biogenesis protein CcdA n=2 Tax=Bacillus paramycoides TaxID=2026194 RepID=UPI002E237A2F|nr:cytochrome c biogenesis protein CcdA [Bacillus paramycoides]MED0971589.1 cytochrome c biogenesis protein CcdA [Bacillus paramycoides]MED1091864.1 cytochrome c biogenesis protein CcdA [Bacillus paramycoides]MED1103193.1 cytochrome c biogenesis protein CcdA [Bacillus paramycoides]